VRSTTPGESWGGSESLVSQTMVIMEKHWYQNALRATHEDCFFFLSHHDTGSPFFLFSQPHTFERPGQRQRAAYRSRKAEGKAGGRTGSCQNATG